jgi:hypothetical protein
MKNPRFIHIFVEAPEAAVRNTLSLPDADAPVFVPPFATEARQAIESGDAYSLIPAQGGCFLVTTNLSPRMEAALATFPTR